MSKGGNSAALPFGETCFCLKKEENNWDEAWCLTRGNSNDIALIEYRSYCWREKGRWGGMKRGLFFEGTVARLELPVVRCNDTTDTAVQIKLEAGPGHT